MIYISTSCIKSSTIKESIEILAKEGFQSIELSGGTEYYDGLVNDLLNLKDKYNLNYSVHNYFPPPKNHFVLNLASLDDSIYNQTVNHIHEALKLCKLIGSPYYSFHAGFRIDPSKDELGQQFKSGELYNGEEYQKKFCTGYKAIVENSQGIKLFIENNVLAKFNMDSLGDIPFMLLSAKDYHELKSKIDFNLLLDVAHLKVTCKTLGLNYLEQFESLFNISKYIHLSENDGLSDSNRPIHEDDEIYSFLKQKKLKEKIFTLEIYSGIEEIKKSYNLIKSLI